jgi:hypothetical protein
LFLQEIDSLDLEYFEKQRRTIATPQASNHTDDKGKNKNKVEPFSRGNIQQ